MSDIIKYDRKNKVGRPPKVLSDERMDEIVQMLLDCKPRKYIVDFLVTNYNISPKSTDHLITNGYKLIKELYQPDRESIILTHISKYYSILNSIEDFDPKAKIAALQAIEKLLKLHQPDVAIQNNTLNLDLKDVSISDLKNLLNT